MESGTGYSEVKIVDYRRAEMMVNEIDTIWIHRNGNPKALSGDVEFNRGPIRTEIEAPADIF